MAPYVSAWDRVGHMVVDAIAWEAMTETTRDAVTELFRSAPAGSDLDRAALSARELFIRAGYWADVVRDEANPERKAAYDRPTWHYVNHFWQGDEWLLEMGTAGELLDRLGGLDPGRDPIELAWTLHLIGDVHQPLHSSGRVTDREPRGDRGGNDFALDDPEAGNAHAYWDSILKRAHTKLHSEGHGAWVSRLAQEIVERYPQEALADSIEEGSFNDWSQAAASLAMQHAYPTYLARGQAPPKRYQNEVLEIAERQIALAGFRLAARLNEAFD